MMKIVEKVIYPIITKTESVVGFHLNDIACQGNHYGIVTNITPKSYRPITINWDDNEPFAYTEDEIRVLKIKVVEELLPQKTIVFMPTGTIPAFLTKKAIGKAKKPTASRFDPGVRSVTEQDSVL